MTTLTINSSDIELMEEFDSLRMQACGEAIGKATDTPAEAVARACKTNEVLGMQVVRSIHQGTNVPGTPVLAEDAAGRLWVVNDLDGPWAIQVAEGKY